MKRREVENDIEALVRTLNTTLEFIRDQDARAREERILLHRPRGAEAAPAQAPRQTDAAPKYRHPSRLARYSRRWRTLITSSGWTMSRQIRVSLNIVSVYLAHDLDSSRASALGQSAGHGNRLAHAHRPARSTNDPGVLTKPVT